MTPELTEDERTELSVHSPNLMCVLEREPPAHVAVTRANAQMEVAALLREIRRLSALIRVNGKQTLEFSRPELRRQVVLAHRSPMTHLVRVTFKLPKAAKLVAGEHGAAVWPPLLSSVNEFQLEILEDYRKEVAEILRAAAKELDP